MGCTSSHTDPYPYEPSRIARRMSARHSFADDYFTAKQKETIRETWEYLDKDPVEKGTRIFLKIFAAKPETKKLFPFRDIDDTSLCKNALFKSHAVRFMHAVGSVVDNLDALDVSCGPTLVRLGKRHSWITNFVNEYLEIFKLAIHEVFQEELGSGKYPDNIRNSWDCVFTFIALKMNEGYKEALSEKMSKGDSPEVDHTHLNSNEYHIRSEGEVIVHHKQNSDEHIIPENLEEDSDEMWVTCEVKNDDSGDLPQSKLNGNVVHSQSLEFTSSTVQNPDDAETEKEDTNVTLKDKSTSSIQNCNNCGETNENTQRVLSNNEDLQENRQTSQHGDH